MMENLAISEPPSEMQQHFNMSQHKAAFERIEHLILNGKDPEFVNDVDKEYDWNIVCMNIQRMLHSRYD